MEARRIIKENYGSQKNSLWKIMENTAGLTLFKSLVRMYRKSYCNTLASALAVAAGASAEAKY